MPSERNAPEVIARIAKLLEIEFGRKVYQPYDQLSANRDLGIDGDDAVELIESIEEEFSIILNLDFRSYFGGEGFFARPGPKALTIKELASMIISASR